MIKFLFCIYLTCYFNFFTFEAQFFPENLGYPVGGAGESKYFYIQWHFENIDRDEGVQEDAGLRLFFTKKYREIEFGVFGVISLYRCRQILKIFKGNIIS